MRKFSLDTLSRNLLFDMEKVENSDEKVRLLKLRINKIINIKNGSDSELIND